MVVEWHSYEHWSWGAPGQTILRQHSIVDCLGFFKFVLSTSQGIPNRTFSGFSGISEICWWHPFWALIVITHPVIPQQSSHSKHKDIQSLTKLARWILYKRVQSSKESPPILGWYDIAVQYCPIVVGKRLASLLQQLSSQKNPQASGSYTTVVCLDFHW